MRIGSLRWWFENRHTGELTVAQFPNWSLYAVAVGSAVRLLSDDDSTVGRVSGVTVTAMWLVWGADELVRGVNPWRRILGSAVIGWQLKRCLDAAHPASATA
jgi:hypothetical protein